MNTQQLNVRLPQVIINDINTLSDIYGSQAYVIIAAVATLKKEIDMKQQVNELLDAISNANNEGQAHAAALRAMAALRVLPEAEQEEVARSEFLRFKAMIDKRVADNEA